MLTLGLIGLSDGNGHPYSWSAIFNGYNSNEMESCGYPVIPRYLEEQSWPECRIRNAEVGYIWTQEASLSEKVSSSSLIKNVVSHPEDMLGSIDALLLARDDAENHYKLASKFIDAGIPIYIDKPIALTLKDLNKLYSLEKFPGQIFTCSALRFSEDLILTIEDKKSLGEIREIVAFTPKSWAKYAVHIIEPVLNMLPEKESIKKCFKVSSSFKGNGSTVAVEWESGVRTTFFATGDGITPIVIKVIGTKGIKELTFHDSFSAFKTALETFIKGVRNRTIESPRCFNEKVVRIIEAGME